MAQQHLYVIVEICVLTCNTLLDDLKYDVNSTL